MTQPDCNTHRVMAAVPEIKNLQALEGKEKGGEGGRKGTCALKMISLVSFSQNVSILNYQRWGRRGGGKFLSPPPPNPSFKTVSHGNQLCFTSLRIEA